MGGLTNGLIIYELKMSTQLLILQVLYNKDCVSGQAIIYWHQKGSKPNGRQHFLKSTETLVKVEFFWSINIYSINWLAFFSPVLEGGGRRQRGRRMMVYHPRTGTFDCCPMSHKKMRCLVEWSVVCTLRYACVFFGWRLVN